MMAGFEVVVRPVVFPNIRPTPKRSLPPLDDPEKGRCVIEGQSGQWVDISDSWSVSTSKSRPHEQQRREDEVRIYQKEDNGTVNKKNFVDVKVANKVWMVDPSVGTIQDGVLIPNSTKAATASSYTRLEEADNVEIRNRDLIRKNPDAPQ
jgi:hypothetical protein